MILTSYNLEEYIAQAMNSVLDQNFDDVELIVVDDCSSDRTFEICQDIAKNANIEVRLFQTESNTGNEGMTCIIGMNQAKGKYILLIDGDDKISENSLQHLATLTDSEPDLICFNRSGIAPNIAPPVPPNPPLADSQYLQDFLRLHMDSGALYTAFRKDFLLEHDIHFDQYVETCTNFIFRANFFAKSIRSTDFNVYVKSIRDGSLSHSTSEAYIEGWYRAYLDIRPLIENSPLMLQAWFDGIDTICAFQIRNIVKYHSEGEDEHLYQYLYDQWSKLRNPNNPRLSYRTKFQMIVDEFDRIVKDPNIEKKSVEIEKFYKSVEKKSWSCYDLRHFITLEPDAIHSCCRVFYRDGKQQGNIVVKTFEADQKYDYESVLDEIKNVKRQIEYDLNRGVLTCCTGCPRVQFEEWGQNDKSFEITAVVNEYQTICNLRCKYCNEMTWGGGRPIWDVQSFLETLIKGDRAKNYRTFAWSGGESVISDNFDARLKLCAESITNTRQMVITNGTVFSKAVEELLAQDKVRTVTSIDAGTDEMYVKVRGQNLLPQVFKNLQRYARANSKNMIVKYIMLNENSSIDELKTFVRRAKEHELLDCAFQISPNFYRQTIDLHILRSIVALYGLLLDAGVNVIFIEEYLRSHLLHQDIKMNPQKIDELHAWLKENQLPDPIETPNDDKVILYGNLVIIELLLNGTLYFAMKKPYKIFSTFDSDVGKTVSVGNQEFTIEKIQPIPDAKIIIAATQRSAELVNELKYHGFTDDQRIKGLIL